MIRNLSSAIGGNEVVMVAEEYLNPGRVASTNTLSTPVAPPLPSTPTQKFFPPNMPPPPYSSHSALAGHNYRNSRYKYSCLKRFYRDKIKTIIFFTVASLE